MLISIAKACELLDTCSGAIAGGVIVSREEVQDNMADLIGKPYGKGSTVMVEIENGTINFSHLGMTLQITPLFPFSFPSNN